MKAFIAVMTFALAFQPGFNGAFAAEEKKAPTPQQERMNNCNKEAGEDRKGDDRKGVHEGMPVAG